MHYYIDGYNLLFRASWNSSKKTLEGQRQALIEMLDRYASLLHLNVTVVFDAPLQTEEWKRCHFRSLEIIFTSRGESADDFLITHFERLLEPKKTCLVSSDKRLAMKAKGFGIRAETVEEFLAWLKKRARKKELLPAPKKIVKEKEKKKEVESDQQVKEIDIKNLPPLSDLVAWEKIFLQQSLKNQNIPKKKQR